MTDILIMQHYSQVSPIHWRWPNFTPEEMASNGNGEVRIVISALDMLQAVRTKWDRPLIINSAYRDMAYNLKIGSTRGSQHPKGTAFDIRTRKWSWEDIYAFKELAYDVGFKGFGGYNTKKGKPKFIHIDARSYSAKWGKSWAWPDAYTKK